MILCREGGRALKQDPQGSGHSPKVVKRIWTMLPRIWWGSGCPAQDQELDSPILMGPIQLSIFFDFMFHFTCFVITHTGTWLNFSSPNTQQENCALQAVPSTFGSCFICHLFFLHR